MIKYLVYCHKKNGENTDTSGNFYGFEIKQDFITKNPNIIKIFSGDSLTEKEEIVQLMQYLYFYIDRDEYFCWVYKGYFALEKSTTPTQSESECDEASVINHGEESFKSNLTLAGQQWLVLLVLSMISGINPMCIGMPKTFIKSTFKGFVPKLYVAGCVYQDGSVEDTSHNSSSSQNGGFKQEGGANIEAQLQKAIDSINEQLKIVYEEPSLETNISQIREKVNKPSLETDDPVKGGQYEAMYDFEEVETDELPFKKGDIVILIQVLSGSEGTKGHGWWEVEHMDTGDKGKVPSHYFELVPEREDFVVTREEAREIIAAGRDRISK